jgi:hypothetical protein
MCIQVVDKFIISLISKLVNNSIRGKQKADGLGHRPESGLLGWASVLLRPAEKLPAGGGAGAGHRLPHPAAERAGRTSARADTRGVSRSWRFWRGAARSAARCGAAATTHRAAGVSRRRRGRQGLGRKVRAPAHAAHVVIGRALHRPADPSHQLDLREHRSWDRFVAPRRRAHPPTRRTGSCCRALGQTRYTRPDRHGWGG